MNTLQTIRVLIADDDVLVLEAIQDDLERLGHTVIGIAVNGLQAIEMTQDLRPDVVLMDIQMPKLDGIMAAQQIQDICPTPVVILTAHEASELVAQARNAGVGGYLLKPPDARQMDRAITIAIARFGDLIELRRVNDALQAQVAERKRAEDALRENEKRFRSVVEQSADGIVLTDEQGYVIEWNQSQEQITGIARAEALGQPLWDMQDRLVFDTQRIPDTREHLRAMVQKIIATGRVPEVLKSQERILQRADGTLRYVQVDEFSVQVERGFILGNVTLDITERKRAEEALRESESKFRNFVRQSSEGIIVTNERGNVVEWNQGLEKLTGLERKDVLDMPIWDFLFQLLPQAYKGTALYERIESAILESLQTGEIPWASQRIEGTYRHLDGSKRIIQQSLFPIETDKGFWIGGILTDITERKQAEAAIKKANDELQTRIEELATLNRITQMVSIVIDRQTVLNIISEAMTQLCRADGTAIALLDESRTELVVEAHYSVRNGSNLIGFAMSLERNPIAAQLVQGELPLVFSQVQTKPLSQEIRDALRARNTQCLMAIPLRARGEIIGGIIIGSGQTDREFTPAETELAETIAGQIAGTIENARLFEEEQKARNEAEEARRIAEHNVRAAEEARNAAETANQAKSVFLANMSHELRTPLNAILGFSELMTRDPTITVEQRENLDTIGRSGEHLLELINDVLELSKIESGRIALQEENFDLHRMLLGLEEMFRFRAANKGLQLTFECTPDVPQYVRADKGKLRQVLINLLGNAVKFTQSGSISLMTALGGEKPRTDTASSPFTLQISVHDTGPGIAPEELDAVFDAFVQTESGRKSQQGTGLGLPISRQFVHMMGGELAVSSRPSAPGEEDMKGGPGSIFQFDVQIASVSRFEIETLREKSENARRVVGLEPGQCAADGGPYRLLVVDDIPASRALLTKLLSSFGPPPQGFDVRSAANGQEAIEIWNEWKPHLIWMDIRMPVMDGHEAIHHINATPQGKDTLVIALTASAFEEERTIALSEGYDDFVRKPFRETEIFDRLARHLNVRFVYQDREREEIKTIESPSEVLTPAALATLPPDWVADLERAALLGDLGSILDLVEQIREPGDAILKADVAAALAALAQNFRYEEILAWLAASG